MTEQTVIDLGVRSVWIAIQVAAPALVAILVVGTAVSIFQAATQINEQTMSFIPKILAMAISMLVFGPWIIKIMMEFTITLVKNIPELTHRNF